MSSKNSKNNKIIVIVGTTASGKTGLGVKLAYKYSGEIISADSRQVYKYMDVGTGKDLEEYAVSTKKNIAVVSGSLRRRSAPPQDDSVLIPHHLIDVVHPNTEFSLAKWIKKANLAIMDIQKRGKLPIVVGGTGLYTQALVDGFDLSAVKPDKELRKKLEKLNVKQLLARLGRLDRGFADNLNASELANKRRLIRYIEMRAHSTQHVSQSARHTAHNAQSDFLILGITWPREMLRKRIYKRLIERLEKEDMAGEVRRLHRDCGVSWKRLRSFGLEYKFITDYLTNKTSYNKMIELLNIAIGQFSKRQMTWLRRWEKQGQKIYWVKNITEANRKIKKFIKR